MSYLAERDNTLIWHPFTQQKTEPFNIAITSGKGAYVFDEQGQSYLDMVSSWWVNLHGHAHPKIAQAIYKQAQTLEHIMFAGFTHAPAVDLCHQLAQILPPALCKFFYSDNGSTAVEVAIKMAYQYWHLQGMPKKTLFLSFEGGYHGDTFGAMSLGQNSGFHDTFSDFLFKVLSVPFPSTYHKDTEIEQKEQHALAILKDHLTQYPNQISAMILEPLIQGSSGMQMCRPSFLQEMVALLKEHQILVIFDEVMTGFGRTGRNFALDHLKITPDFLCLSKGLSGGFLPLALTVTQESIYSVFANQSGRYTFPHGHSYTANPLACAAGISSLELLLATETQNQIDMIANTHLEGIKLLVEHPNLHHFRQLGTIAACTTKQPLPTNFRHDALKKGLILRPLGQHIYFLPPYCISQSELMDAYHTLSELIAS